MKTAIKQCAIIILSTLWVLVGCNEESVEYSPSSLLPEGMVKLTLDYDILHYQQVNTRSGKAVTNGLNNAVLLIFDAPNIYYQEETDALLEMAVIEDITSSDVSFIVKAYKGNCRVKVLANLSSEQLNIIKGYTTLNSSSTPTTVAEIKKLTVPFSLLNNPSAAGQFPLCGSDGAVINGIDGKTDLKVTLKNVYARFDLKLHDTITNFVLDSVYIDNMYPKGRIEPYGIYDFPDLIHSDFVRYGVKAHDQRSIGAIDLFEIQNRYGYEAYPTSIILVGTYFKDGNRQKGYYKIYLEYRYANNDYSYAVNRNSHYKAVVKMVKHYGYPTYAEAMRAASENSPINMDVTVDDLEPTNDMLFHNGGYSISVTNSDVDIYAASPTQVYAATQVVFDTTFYGTFIPSRSVKLLNNANEGGITILNEQEILNQPIGKPVDLKVRCAAPGASATVEIRHGGLRKLINIRAHKMLRSNAMQCIEVADVLNVRYENEYDYYPWVRISQNMEYPSSSALNYTFNQPTKINCLMLENTGDIRTSPLYMFRGFNKGTLKVIVTQTYGSPYINDLYYRESYQKNNAAHKAKRANCFLIPTKEAQTYKLTGSRIFDYYGTNYIPNKPKAEIVWSTFNMKDPNVFEPHDLIEVELPNANCEEVIFRVRRYHTTCADGGNGSVTWGIKDNTGTWLWSWHAWLTDMVSETNYPAVPSIGYTGYTSMSVLASKREYSNLFESLTSVSQRNYRTYANNELRVYLDRNLGAKATAYSAVSNVMPGKFESHFGFLYQWGRKDPLPYLQKKPSSVNEDVYYYTSSSPNYFIYNSVVVGNEMVHTDLVGIQNPLTFYASPKTHTSNPNLVTRWKEGTGKGTKTIHDPSPYGWRINWGDGTDLFMYTPKWVGTDSNGGAIFNDNFYFSATCSRSYTNGSTKTYRDQAFYWCAVVTPPSESSTNAKVSDFGFDRNKPNSCYVRRYNANTVSFGFDVRPVLDSE
ncbi:MAG: hypothetical protein ACRDDZ_07630 [Marinifilaceae bacterium]